MHRSEYSQKIRLPSPGPIIATLRFTSVITQLYRTVTPTCYILTVILIRVAFISVSDPNKFAFITAFFSFSKRIGRSEDLGSQVLISFHLPASSVLHASRDPQVILIPYFHDSFQITRCPICFRHFKTQINLSFLASLLGSELSSCRSLTLKPSPCLGLLFLIVRVKYNAMRVSVSDLLPFLLDL